MSGFKISSPSGGTITTDVPATGEPSRVDIGHGRQRISGAIHGGPGEYVVTSPIGASRAAPRSAVQISSSPTKATESATESMTESPPVTEEDSIQEAEPEYGRWTTDDEDVDAETHDL